MPSRPEYLFRSERLGFRNWASSDLAPLAAINGDPRVMEFFPATQSRQQTESFIARMQEHLEQQGFCYFAVDEFAGGQLIGFIGLYTQTFAADFTPCIDIGWRLAPQYWGQGYAVEGALACLHYAFDSLGIPQVYAVAPRINLPSIRVMEKIGLQFQRYFEHPLLPEDERLRTCALYAISAGESINPPA